MEKKHGFISFVIACICCIVFCDVLMWLFWFKLDQRALTLYFGLSAWVIPVLAYLIFNARFEFGSSRSKKILLQILVWVGLNAVITIPLAYLVMQGMQKSGLGLLIAVCWMLLFSVISIIISIPVTIISKK